MDEPPHPHSRAGRRASATSTSGRSRGPSGPSFHLRRWNALSTEPEPVDGFPDSFIQQPPQETAVVARADYLTPPAPRAARAGRPAALYLHAAIDAEDTNWIVALADVAPDGTAVELTRGFLKASHRALDEERSLP